MSLLPPPTHFRFAVLVFAILGVVGLGFTPPAHAAGALQAALEPLNGAWQGELRVHALDGFLLKTFPAQRHYRWTGDSQLVVTRFFDGASDYEVQATQIADAGRLSATVVRPGQVPEEYVGVMEAGALVWTNTSNNKRDYTERLVTVDGVTKLEVTSSEIMRVKGVSGVVRVTGTFLRGEGAARSGMAAASPAASSVAPGGPSSAVEREALRARVAELEKEQADLAERAAKAADATARIAELERKALVAERATEGARSVAAAEMSVSNALRDRIQTLETQLREAAAALATAQAGTRGASNPTQLLNQRDAELAELRVRLERADAELIANRLQLDQARVGQDAAEARAASADTAAARLADLQAQLQTARAAREQASAEAANLAEQLAQLRAQSDAAGRRSADASAETARLAARVKELDTARTVAETARRAAESASVEAEGRQAGLRERMAQLENELDAVRAARVQQEQDNAAASSALLATRGEADRLSARIKELENAVATAAQSSAATTAAAGTVERERADLRQQVAALARAAEEANGELAKVRADRDALAARLAVLAARPEVTADALAAERRDAGERLAQAEAAASEATARRAAVEEQLAAARASATRAEAASAGMEELRLALATAQVEATAFRRQVDLLQSERDRLAFRLSGIDEAVTGCDAALQAAEAAVADARRRAETAEARLQQLEGAGAATAGLRAELEAHRTRAAEQEQQNGLLIARLAELARERAALDARVAGTEPTTGGDPGAVTFSLSSPPANVPPARREELHAENLRLQRQVTELESERNSIRDSQAFLQGQLEQTRQLRDETLARFQDLVAQSNTMREDRDRLARANASLQAELRGARGPGATPVAATGSTSYLDRLIDATEVPPPAATAARPAAGQPAPASPVIEGKIAALQVIGITRADDGDKVILNGRLYRSGDIIDPAAGIVFERVDGDALVFTDGNGREYRRRY